MKLKGKIAFVTGAGRNIGRAIILALAQEGADVVLITRQNRGGLEKVAKEVSALGVGALPLLADISDAQAIKEAVCKAEDRFGKVDILVNNAVERIRVPFMEMTTEQWQRGFNINLGGPFNCAQAVLPGMMSRKWGRIINFSGVSALWGGSADKGGVIVPTAKAGIIGFTKSLARGYGKYNITVNAIAPGGIEVTRQADDTEPRDTTTRAAIRRQGRPEEVASLIAYLCTDDAGYITGQVLSVSGGAYM